jgi:hypothetical protein
MSQLYTVIKSVRSRKAWMAGARPAICRRCAASSSVKHKFLLERLSPLELGNAVEGFRY